MGCNHYNVSSLQYIGYRGQSKCIWPMSYTLHHMDLLRPVYPIMVQSTDTVTINVTVDPAV